MREWLHPLYQAGLSRDRRSGHRQLCYGASDLPSRDHDRSVVHGSPIRKLSFARIGNRQHHSSKRDFDAERANTAGAPSRPSCDDPPCSRAGSGRIARDAQAARMLPTNRSTLSRKASDSRTRPCAEPSTSPAATPVLPAAWLTLVMCPETSVVPAAACCTLRAISWVAAPCCSTAAAIAAAI